MTTLDSRPDPAPVADPPRPAHDLVSDLRQPTRDLRGAIRDTWDGFSHLHRNAVSEGALPAKVKELIALAIAVDEGCEGCIAYHAAGAARRGATEQEVAEALGVVLLMRGGPASVHGPLALQTFREFAEDSAT
jgi:AhpD family alkylhydroperoxidase